MPQISKPASALVFPLLSYCLDRLVGDVQDLLKAGCGARQEGKAIAEAALLACLLSRALPGDERLPQVGALLAALVRTPSHRMALIRHPRVAYGPTGLAHRVAVLLGHPDAAFDRLLDDAEKVEPYAGFASLPWIAAQGEWARRLFDVTSAPHHRSPLPHGIDPLMIESEDLFNVCHVLWYTTDFGANRIDSFEYLASREVIEALLVGRLVAGDMGRACELLVTRLVFDGPLTAPPLWALATLLDQGESLPNADRHTVYAAGIALSVMCSSADLDAWDQLQRLDPSRPCPTELHHTPIGSTTWGALRSTLSQIAALLPKRQEAATTDENTLVHDLEACALAGIYIRAGRAGDFALLRECMRLPPAPHGPLRAVQRAAAPLLSRLTKHMPGALGASAVPLGSGG